MPLRRWLILLLAATALGQTPERPAAFARPLEQEGLPNLHEVTPQLYRSGQPWGEGLKAAEKLGVKTIICLRDDGTDDEVAAGTKLKLVRVPMGLNAVDEEAVIRALKLLGKKEAGPFLVHCQMGADRTGVVMAMWRMTVQGWSREDALAEMDACGVGLPEFRAYVKDVDLAKFRAKLAAAK